MSCWDGLTCIARYQATTNHIYVPIQLRYSHNHSNDKSRQGYILFFLLNIDLPIIYIHINLSRYRTELTRKKSHKWNMLLIEFPRNLLLGFLSSSNCAVYCKGVCASKSHDLKMQRSLSFMCISYRWWGIMLWKPTNFRSILSQISFRFSTARSTLHQQVFFQSPGRFFHCSVSLFFLQ